MFEFDDKTKEVLLRLEETQHEFWNIDRETAKFLSVIILSKKPKNALEIGTSNGYSGIWQGIMLKKTGGRLTTIEYWDKRQSVAIENFKICGVDDVIEPRLGPAFAVLDNITKEIEENKRPLFDYVFIDANKKEYIDYFRQIHPILDKGGIILADNMISHKEKVKPFYDEIMNHSEYKSTLLSVGTGILMAVKD